MRATVFFLTSALAIAAADSAAAEADGPDFWDVSGVRADDALNLHAEPSARSRTIAGIPPDAKGLRNRGCRVPSFREWQRMSDAERSRSARSRWCKVEYQGRTGWVAGRFLVEGAAPGAAGAPPAAAIGAWRVSCAGSCVVEQTGIAGSKTLHLRLELRDDVNARVVLQRAAFPRIGTLTIYMDGELITTGPIAPLRSKDGKSLVMEPDDITLGLLKRMRRHKNMVINFPGEERGVEFHLDDFDKALAAAKSANPAR